MKRELLALLGLGVLAAGPLLAQETAAGGQKPDEKAKEEETVRRAEEVTVESASKVASKLIDAPATMSVVDERSPRRPARPEHGGHPALRPGDERHPDLGPRHQPDRPAGDIDARHLPARDGRRSLRLPRLLRAGAVGPRAVATSGEIKQIEVVRGPASVVWGANAVNGVVNIITKTPRENEGFGVVLGAGFFDRDGGSRESEGTGYQFNGSFSYANAINDTWSYRLNAGYFNSDPYSRPVGTGPARLPSPGVVPCRSASGAEVPGASPSAAPPSPRTPTSRAPSRTREPASRSSACASTRTSRTGPHHLRGRLLRHGGDHPHRIGPFRLESGSYMAYGRVGYTKGALRINAFGNFLDAEAPNLLLTNPDTLGRSSWASRRRPTTSRSATPTCSAGGTS